MYLTTAWLRPDSGRQRLWIGGRRERSTLWLTWLCLVRERATTGGFMDQRPQRRSGRLRVVNCMAYIVARMTISVSLFEET